MSFRPIFYPRALSARPRGDVLEVTYQPHTLDDHITRFFGEQLRPCVYSPGHQLTEALFPEGGVEDVEIFNLHNIHTGLGDYHAGWGFSVRFVRAECDCV